MTTIADWADRPPPIDAGAEIAAVRQRFLDDSAVAALAVVLGGEPVGLVLRKVALSADDGVLTSGAPVSSIMSRARVMRADTSADAALDVLLEDGGCGEGVILAGPEGYEGLVDQASLLKALKVHAAARQGRDGDDNQFTTMLSREMKASLTGVLAVAELLQRQPLTADAKAYAQTIIDSSTGLVRLLEHAHDLALAQSGRLDFKAEPVQLREAMDRIQTAWQSHQSDSVAVLIAYDGEHDLAVNADGGRLAQVYGVLIDAALKTTRQGAVEASLKATTTTEGVRLEGRVRDQGPGLEPGRLARLFDPSAHAGSWSWGGWSGPALALCRHLVEAMGGTIHAQSNVGEGVTVSFDLLLPRAEVELEVAPAPTVGSDGGAIHVLVVDDNATNRMVAEGLCEMFDCTSETAEDGVQAVEAASSGRFDLILMDIKMPRMDGVEATKKIRAMKGPAGKVPIIALTANADPDDAQGYLACGMASVVEKPIKPERLLAAMNAALDGEPDDKGSVRAA